MSLDDPIFRTPVRGQEGAAGAALSLLGGHRRPTSERGDDSREPHFRAIRDDKGRIMVVMTHNTDVADSWEREGEEPAYFQRFSVDGYALGVDVLLYAQTH